MTRTMERAPCKANLYLDVTGPRPDGYHGIESVMITLPLFDTVTVERTDDIISVKMKDLGASGGTEDLPERENLAYQASELFFRATGIKGGADVTIEKRIPARAGLAGGSADAAATLRALRRLYGAAIDDDALCRLALSLGADVPFCVAGGAALCRGIGEIMTPIDVKMELHGVITSEKAEKRSTRDAYRMVDEAMCRIRPKYTAADMATALEAGDVDALGERAYNVFSKACGYPDDARRLLRSLGAPFVLMSGAGPSVVALTYGANDSSEIRKELIDKGFTAFSF